MIRFEVLVQPSRHAPVAVVECVERAVLARAVLEPVLKPEILRQLVPAEALLQREDNASFSRCSRSVSCCEKICISAYLQCLLACEAELCHGERKRGGMMMMIMMRREGKG